jgi:tRNA1Val (adenine37-N6)-methyltransferase
MKRVKDFVFKKFRIVQTNSTHKVGTDGVLLGAWADVVNAQTILDIGTGSGVIALMLAQRNATATIDALEIQKADAMQAEENFRSSPWSDRLTIYHQALQEFKTQKQYDLIVTNPPFFINSFLPPNNNRTLVRHTAELSFDALLDTVVKLLKPDGQLSLILPVAEGKFFIDAASARSLYLKRLCEFKSREHKPVERLLMEFGYAQQETLQEQLTLYAESSGEDWSVAYKMLTREFYLKI